MFPFQKWRLEGSNGWNRWEGWAEIRHSVRLQEHTEYCSEDQAREAVVPICGGDGLPGRWVIAACERCFRPVVLNLQWQIVVRWVRQRMPTEVWYCRFSLRGRVVMGVGHLDHVWSYGVREVVSSIPDRGNIVGWVFRPDQVTGKVFSSEHAFPSKFWIYLEHCPRGEAVITGHLRLSSMRYPAT